MEATVTSTPTLVYKREAFLMGHQKVDGACVPQSAWHPSAPRFYGSSIAEGGVCWHWVHFEILRLVIVPTLNVSDERVLEGKRAHETEQLLQGFIVDSLLGSLPRLLLRE